MVVPLKCEKLVNGPDRDGVCTAQPHNPATRNRVSRVLDGRFASSHLPGSRDLASMHETGQREVAPTECAGNLPHVSSNLSHTGSIGSISLEGDAATIRQRLEAVQGGVLIDPHGTMPARLYLGECAVG
jgi:hypothetical protein